MNFYCVKPKTKRRKGLSLPPLGVCLFCLLICLGQVSVPCYMLPLFCLNGSENIFELFFEPKRRVVLYLMYSAF